MPGEMDQIGPRQVGVFDDIFPARAQGVEGGGFALFLDGKLALQGAESAQEVKLPFHRLLPGETHRQNRKGIMVHLEREPGFALPVLVFNALKVEHVKRAQRQLIKQLLDASHDIPVGLMKVLGHLE